MLGKITIYGYDLDGSFLSITPVVGVVTNDRIYQS